eukprot:COSAG02_NODE_11077_length_1798_cov_2.128899_3_plen_149_part_01
MYKVQYRNSSLYAEFHPHEVTQTVNTLYIHICRHGTKGWRFGWAAPRLPLGSGVATFSNTDGGSTMMLRGVHTEAGVAAPPPAEEVKLYAQKAAAQIHPWADLIDVCRIVDNKAKLPGMLLDKGRLRQAVCDELEQREPELRETYKRRR